MTAESRRLSVIVFTDIVGYSRLVQTDESKALQLLEEHNRIVAERIGAHGGRTIKTIGDAFMADFGSAASAVTAAAEIQQALAERNAAVPADRQVHIRIGIHAGDVIFTSDAAGAADALGDGVNVASRVEAEAGADQVFVSHDVFSITYERVPFGYRDVGTRELKNISRPIHIYELLWDPARVAEANAKPPRSGTSARGAGRVGWGVAAIAIMAAIAVVIFHSTPQQATLAADGRPSVVVIDFSDDTGDEKMGRLQIGRILGDAVEQKFYEYLPIHLVSPLRVETARRDLGYTEGAVDAGALADIAREAGGRLVISGSLALVGGSYVLRAELSDLTDGATLGRFQQQNATEAELLGLVDSLCVHFQQRLIDVLNIGTKADLVLEPVGELTTFSLPAYGHFQKGHDLYHGGRILEGAEELVRALELDSTFALAASDAACAFSFAKEHDREKIYFALAQRQAGDNLRAGMSKGALIFQGNDAWLSDPSRPAEAQARYEMIVRLYPDDPDGYYYTGMVHTYLMPDHAAGGDRDEELRKAMAYYEEAALRNPGYFPIYFDWSDAIRQSEGPEAAAGFLRQYLKEFGEGPGAGSARKALEELRRQLTD
jgi:adenylate cyclase